MKNKKDVVIYRKPGTHCAFPGLIKLDETHLLIAFREATAHRSVDGIDVALRSLDAGQTWNPETRVVICDRFPDSRDPALVHLSDGSILCTFLYHEHDMGRLWRPPGPPHGVQREKFRTAASISGDDGKTWGEPIKIQCAELDTFSNRSPAIELPDGTLLLPTAGRPLDSHIGRAAVLRSSDGGKSWDGFAVAAHDPTERLVFGEPNLCLLPDGRTLILLHTGEVTEQGVQWGHMYQAYSTDYGHTWSKAEKTEIWGYPQHLLLLRDGRLLCTYGYRREPLGVRGCLSLDMGQTWDLENEFVLRDDGIDWDLGYSKSVELEDNHILTVYYFHDASGDFYIAGSFYEL